MYLGIPQQLFQFLNCFYEKWRAKMIFVITFYGHDKCPSHLQGAWITGVLWLTQSLQNSWKIKLGNGIFWDFFFFNVGYDLEIFEWFFNDLKKKKIIKKRSFGNGSHQSCSVSAFHGKGAPKKHSWSSFRWFWILVWWPLAPPWGILDLGNNLPWDPKIGISMLGIQKWEFPSLGSKNGNFLPWNPEIEISFLGIQKLIFPSLELKNRNFHLWNSKLGISFPSAAHTDRGWWGRGSL